MGREFEEIRVEGGTAGGKSESKQKSTGATELGEPGPLTSLDPKRGKSVICLTDLSEHPRR